MIKSSYTDRARLIVLQHGAPYLGKWMVQEVDILKDYQKAFGKRPPAMASIAVIKDSDNTGEAPAYQVYIFHDRHVAKSSYLEVIPFPHIKGLVTMRQF